MGDLCLCSRVVDVDELHRNLQSMDHFMDESSQEIQDITHRISDLVTRGVCVCVVPVIVDDGDGGGVVSTGELGQVLDSESSSLREFTISSLKQVYIDRSHPLRWTSASEMSGSSFEWRCDTGDRSIGE